MLGYLVEYQNSGASVFVTQTRHYELFTTTQKMRRDEFPK